MERRPDHVPAHALRRSAVQRHRARGQSALSPRATERVAEAPAHRGCRAARRTGRCVRIRAVSDAERPLDHPVWSCLATWHAHFARGDDLARRYVETISPIGAVSGASPRHIAALEALVGVGEDVALIGPAPELPANWETLYASRLTQMIRRDRSPLPEGDVEPV